jgi:hypothetical protein
MTTELMRYNGYRYVMRKGQRFSCSDDADKTKAGRAMLMSADMHLWESNAALVARVESFLRGGFSWYLQSDKSARDTLQTLLSYVHDGAVDIFQEGGATTNAFENSGFTLDPPARHDRPDTQPFETVEESEMPFLLSVVSMVARSANLEREAMQKAASGFDQIAGNVNTPLGDAVPFEYAKSATGNDVLSIAARGVSESHEAECHAMYEFELDQCEFTRAIYNDPRSYALCKQHAFTNYETCRGY